MAQAKRSAVRRNYPSADTLGRPEGGWRLSLYRIMFEADCEAGRRFDQAVFVVILASLAVVMADSVEFLAQRYGRVFTYLEWTFTIIFTVEYVLRLLCVRNPWRYALSFYGVVDLLAFLPSYAALLLPNLTFLIGIRVLRLLRIFRVFKLRVFADEYAMLGRALRASARKTMVFLSVVLLIVLVMGTVMYVVEGPENGFTSIPTSVYWAISTIATVGFGDITPHTPLGRFVASVMMLLGWGILAVPTGIFTMEMTLAETARRRGQMRTCQVCMTPGQDQDANYCKHCGARMEGAQAG
ncbi:MAG: ion transporter [Pigmentiphaga sp.]|uniref:ion transporter n=1 Tax=Pigmentiphaga sp. TaxID=1977564 RepID=UPI0029BB8F4F|nr:ion transporter [Pigmentiphaga sp.]MDX3905536.1 ion transporter [Pigmentiphaga sp.]